MAVIIIAVIALFLILGGRCVPARCRISLLEAKRLGRTWGEGSRIDRDSCRSYGKDLQQVGFIDVLEGLQQIDEICRIRLSSLEPSLLTKEFCKRAAMLDKLCPHFHVSLQSGSTSVLRRMHRKYTAEEYADYIANLREAFVNPAVTTDVIAGFQGETEEEHQETLQFLQQIGFAKLHVFPYSKREGTLAARMQGDLPGNVKKRQSRRNDSVGRRNVTCL